MDPSEELSAISEAGTARKNCSIERLVLLEADRNGAKQACIDR